MYGEACHENQLHHEAEAEAGAGTGVDRAAVAATVAAVRTADLAGTKANLDLWLLADGQRHPDGMPLPCISPAPWWPERLRRLRRPAKSVILRQSSVPKRDGSKRRTHTFLASSYLRQLTTKRAERDSVGRPCPPGMHRFSS